MFLTVRTVSPSARQPGRVELRHTRLLQRLGHRPEQAQRVLGSPGGHRDSAAVPGAPAHFRDSGDAVGEELQPVLAQHHVETVILSCDRRRRALQVLNRRPSGSLRPGRCRRQHGAAESAAGREAIDVC
jgi:hypothetical protein